MRICDGLDDDFYTVNWVRKYYFTLHDASHDFPAVFMFAFNFLKFLRTIGQFCSY